MPAAVKTLRWILRIGFLLALLPGLALWTGHGYGYLRAHMALGFLITFALLVLVVISLISRVSPALPILSFLWSVALPVVGIAQLRLLPGANHWLIQVLHFILGLGAIGLGEVLSKKVLLQQRA